MRYVPPGGPGFSVSQAFPGIGSRPLVNLSACVSLWGLEGCFRNLQKLLPHLTVAECLMHRHFHFPPSLIHCCEEVCSLQMTFANSQRGTWGSNWGCSLPKSAPAGTWQVSSVRHSVLGDKCSSFVVSFKPQHKSMK